MKRTVLKYLEDWLVSAERKPLVLRGARQVGKTWLIRHLAQQQKRKLIELNFEKQPHLLSLFVSNDSRQILLNLRTILNGEFAPENSLLFLDEIQAAPDILPKLRWFAEDLPELPVIAAGSLLEFVLEKHTFSMPVGRISYMHLEPLSFEEFLQANDKQGLLDFISTYKWDDEVPIAIHDQIMLLFKEYIIIGGMPAVLSNWIKNQSLTEVNRIHHDLIATYRDDFAKYSGRIEIERLDEVMMTVPRHLGQKFVYTSVNPKASIPSIKQSLGLLCKAKVCYRVIGCAANGIPLGAEIREKYLKIIFLDVGLCSAALGISLDQLYNAGEINLINKGGIAEQVVGQILRTTRQPYIEPVLYYWHREEKGSEAEVDYVIQHHNQVIPVEVKAGSTGGLKSLHLFMGLKGYLKGVRINSDLPSQTHVNVKDSQGNQVNYILYSLPFYLLGQLHRLLK